MQDETQQSLSRRQAEIANLVVAGKTSRKIAEALSLSPRTVEHHLEAIFNKLGVGSRVELVTALLRGPSQKPERQGRAGPSPLLGRVRWKRRSAGAAYPGSFTHAALHEVGVPSESDSD